MAWQLPLDRLRVHAALQVLTERYDAAAAGDVIVAFHRLPADSEYRDEKMRHTRSGGSVAGTTPEHGDVTVRNDGERITVTGGARTYERIGQFKVFRIDRGPTVEIVFRHYWKSDLATAIEPPAEWSLIYSVPRLDTLALIRRDWASYTNHWRTFIVMLHDLLTGRRTTLTSWKSIPAILFQAEGFRIRIK